MFLFITIFIVMMLNQCFYSSRMCCDDVFIDHSFYADVCFFHHSYLSMIIFVFFLSWYLSQCLLFWIMWFVLFGIIVFIMICVVIFLYDRIYGDVWFFYHVIYANVCVCNHGIYDDVYFFVICMCGNICFFHHGFYCVFASLHLLWFLFLFNQHIYGDFCFVYPCFWIEFDFSGVNNNIKFKKIARVCFFHHLYLS